MDVRPNQTELDCATTIPFDFGQKEEAPLLLSWADTANRTQCDFVADFPFCSGKEHFHRNDISNFFSASAVGFEVQDVETRFLSTEK